MTAEMIAERAGKPWRPSNGTDGECFIESACVSCTRFKAAHGRCAILNAAFLYGIDEKGYPKEWQYGDDGWPTCTAYSSLEDRAIKIRQHKPLPGQGTLFGEES